MTRTARLAPVSLALLCAACGSTAKAPSPEIQSIVDSVASRHTGVRRLTVHGVPEGETSSRVIASTSKSKLGKPSDREDLDAMRAGHTVVLVEPGALDVTVPILQPAAGGKHTSSVGVTLEMPAGADRAELERRGREIAAEVESAIISRRP